MNRAERRKLEKLQKRDPSILAKQAAKLYVDGNLEAAEEKCQEIIAKFPNNFDAFQILGLIESINDNHKSAIDLFKKASALAPNDASTFYNLGNALVAENKIDDAIAAFKKSIEISPNNFDAYNNLGTVYMKIHETEMAKDIFEAVLEKNPGYTKVLSNLGAAYNQLGFIDKAVETLEKSIGASPENRVGAQTNLGLALVSKGDFEGALKYFRLAADTKQNHGQDIAGDYVFTHQIKHDYEQVNYLYAKGILKPEDEKYRNALDRLYQRSKGSDKEKIEISIDEAKNISPSYNRIINYNEGKAIEGGSLNPALNVDALEAQYNEAKNSQSEHVYIDDFLNREALNSLRNFCLESTIWKSIYKRGYLGARLGDGFSAPIIFQISEDLRTTFPGIFKDHKLYQAWGFKYDSTMTGIDIHADFAAVNVNFWISPDEGNLDHNSGGLVVWDKAAPKDWSFKEYNEDEKKIQKFLQESNAEKIVVPHRQNRAMIFNSTLFHKTDDFEFNDNFENRRINVTFLYGQGLKT